MTFTETQPALALRATQRAHYDGVTIAFHWATVVLVLILFGSAVTWQWAPRDLGWRRPLESLHVSMGILLAAVFIGRAVWRAAAGRRLPPADHGIRQVAAQIVHGLLYLLLALQVCLGFGLRWVQGETFSFFGLFSIPPLVGANDALERPIENFHNLTAWAIIYLAAGHAIAALAHRYWLKDGVLQRMLPGRRRA